VFTFVHTTRSEGYPSIARQEIREPPLHRRFAPSGTTVLHTLLALDPEHRVPLTWEVMTPSPPTGDNEKRRIQRAISSCNSFNWLAPTFRQVHPVGAELPQECVSLMAPTFLSDQFDAIVLCPFVPGLVLSPGFATGIRVSPPVSSTSAGPAKRAALVLKAPTHMFALPSLLAVYPDALLSKPIERHSMPWLQYRV